ncbi:hypothetical protein ASPZODRAFT_17198 [Penicilliopsis zonata CBS 506.65]|uniref:MARVEL domain-containing protein n=1 Tax=Penicilliopsis zonata CBS 506.65 TaxID=1073090 RepID=A0A1L9SER9_9EURO|nr:hypothetical protein ASPZODRAFT_17198 [Penicilliopsis zonata CBS 506.65]OJJ45755.1 hypothetical protein ASPZODRAFT_17198 [Penicilliopsis zonata CBS 506.65]
MEANTTSAASFSSGSYHASCASDADESAYLRRAGMLQRVRLGISFIIFSAAIAIIACEAQPLNHYRSTSSTADLRLYLWPLNLDKRPTTALLSCGCVIAFQTLVYILASFLPSPRSYIRTLNLLASALAFSGFVTSVTGFVFAIYLPSSSYPTGFTYNETIHTWTCKWKSLDESSLNGTSLTAPAHFSRDCMETSAGFVLLGLLIGLEVIMGLAAGTGLWFEYKVMKQRKAENLELEKVHISTLKN